MLQFYCSHSNTMSTRTNGADRRGLQQSRPVYSCPTFHLFPGSQQHTMADTILPGASRRFHQEYFVEHGLCIPLFKRGEKRPHARSAEDLTGKSKQSLTVIVKSYAQSRAPKLLKTLISRPALVEWVEGAETLALGPHPESKLPCTLNDLGH